MPVIKRCVLAKQEIVDADPLENGFRRILNFGHTIGHAFESWSHENGEGMLHGEAIAMGMYCELWLSQQLFNLPESILEGYGSWYRRHFTPKRFTGDDYDRFFYFMSQDKKKTGGQLRFVLIEELAKPVFDVSVQQDLLIESLDYFRTSCFDDKEAKV
jgi:3-dehydroquinate synthase